MTPPATPVLETDRLCLRRATTADADFFLELLNDPTFVQNIGDREIRTADDARHYIESAVIATYERIGFGLYVVERKNDGARTGICGLLKRECLPDIDVGFAFLPAFRGQGLAFEASVAVLHHAREDFGIGRVLAVAKPGNVRSIHLLEKLGFVPLGRVHLPGQMAESRLFGIAAPGQDGPSQNDGPHDVHVV